MITIHRGLPAVALLTIMLVGCGGPDAAALWHEAETQIAVATTAVQQGDWTKCRPAWQAAVAVVSPVADVQVGGQTVGARLDSAKAGLAAELGNAQARLVAYAEQDQAKLLEVMKLVIDLGTPSQVQTWQSQESPRIKALQAEREHQAKLAAEEANRARMAKSWLVQVVMMPADKSSDVRDRKHLEAALTKAFAPIPIELVDHRPVRRTGVGFARLSLRWEEVGFGSGNSEFAMPGHQVPEQVDAILTVTSNVMPSTIDGDHTWHASAQVPNQVNMLTVNRLREEKRAELLDALAARIATLSVGNAEELMKAAAERPLDVPAWAFRFTSQTITTKQGHMARTGYGSLGASARDAIASVFAPNDLVNAEDLTGAKLGTVEVAMTVMEVPFGSSSGMVQTLNGNIPVKLSLAIRVQPQSGTSSWKEPRTFSTELASPGQISREALPYIAVQRVELMLRDIGKQLTKEPAVTITP
jgi:hypothetical protein